MDRRDYDEYLRRFHAHDYDGLLEFFADEFEVVFAGYRLASRQQVKAFYSFLHEYLDERIVVHRFLADADTVVLEADIVLTGKKLLTPELLKEKGYERLTGLPVGVSVTLTQFIHYHLRDGKFVRALCAILELPR